MALNIDDYFEESDSPVEEAPVDQQPSQGADNGGEPRRDRQDDRDAYRDAFIVTNGQRRRRRWRRIGIVAALIVVVAILVDVLFVSKKVEKGCVRGYLVKVELCDGIMFDSYECTLVADLPDRMTNQDDLLMRFSIRDRDLGKKVFDSMKGDSVVLVNYVRYATKMPWRGETDVLADSAVVMAAPTLRSASQVALDRKAYGAKQDTTKRK